MTVTYLPATQEIHDEATRQNFEYLESHGVYLDNVNSPDVVVGKWITPTLINSWANLGSGTVGAGYLKDPFGFVHLRGRILGGAAASIAFALPPGYRPSSAGSDDYAAAGYDGVTGSVPVFVNVASNGNVSIWFSTGPHDVGLGGINFLAEN